MGHFTILRRINGSIAVFFARMALNEAIRGGISPNNEYKIIRGVIATLKYFRIFNRWWDTVFDTMNMNKGWNCEYNSISQPFAVCMYQTGESYYRGKIFTKQRNTTLIR
jgi:hypothetical protein